MPTLVREKIPVHLAPRKHLTESHQFKGVEGEICWILEATPVVGLSRRQFIPLLAGHLTATAGRTFGGVYEKRFISHSDLTSF
jgi:hypothetical protein